MTIHGGWNHVTRGRAVAILPIAVAVAALAFDGSGAIAGDVTGDTCKDCHDKAEGKSESHHALISGSSHEDMGCLDCHVTVEQIPHAEDMPAVDCGMCHDDVVKVYEWHARLEVKNGGDIPGCHDCHGTHDILGSSDPKSMVYPHNLPFTCGKCHQDVDMVAKHDILYDDAVDVYESSIHGVAALNGSTKVALCNDCHSSNGTAHRILPPSDPESSINHFNIPKTCGKCHEEIAKEYWEGIHGQLARRGETDAPVCTNCHGEHGILKTDDPRAAVSPTRLAEATCTPCHDSARLNEKYGIPTGRLQSFIDTYHGLKSRAGDVSVANCASCHGAHLILPHTNSRSSIHPRNLKTTCGHCHPGISTAMATAPIHGTPGVSQTPVAGIVRTIYVWLIAIIIGGMIVHWLLDLGRQIVDLVRRRGVTRMKPIEVVQHTLLAVTFITLVLTGFSLRFSRAWWVMILFGWDGGFPLRGVIHRVSAALFMATVVFHLGYLLTPRGRRFIRDMLPSLHDARQALQMVGFNLGMLEEPPAFGRFGYVEKAEYWALVWGSVAMIATGLMLWFDNLVAQWFPKGVLDVMLVIHYYEAWLAALAILIWHMYSTVFSPRVYPMNPSWITGKMPAEMHRHEHPAEKID